MQGALAHVAHRLRQVQPQNQQLSSCHGKNLLIDTSNCGRCGHAVRCLPLATPWRGLLMDPLSLVPCQPRLHTWDMHPDPHMYLAQVKMRQHLHQHTVGHFPLRRLRQACEYLICLARLGNNKCPPSVAPARPAPEVIVKEAEKALLVAILGPRYGIPSATTSRATLIIAGVAITRFVPQTFLLYLVLGLVLKTTQLHSA